jgi:choline dehydrogenase-like flavoprotein
MLIEIAGTAGARFGAQVPSGDPPGSGHLMATRRSGDAPATLVYRPDGRFHDVGDR